MSNKVQALTRKKICQDKNQYLQNVLDRINNDIDPYVEFVRGKIKKKEGAPGVFALTRMVFPIIESVAIPLGYSQQNLLRRLGFNYPYLFWTLYRDGFLHNDEFLEYEYEGKEIFVGIVTGVEGEIIQQHAYGNEVILSIFKLINDLKEFLKQEITTSTGEIERVGKIIYSNPSKLKKDDPNYKELVKVVNEISEIRSKKLV